MQQLEQRARSLHQANYATPCPRPVAGQPLLRATSHVQHTTAATAITPINGLAQPRTAAAGGGGGGGVAAGRAVSYTQTQSSLHSQQQRTPSTVPTTSTSSWLERRRQSMEIAAARCSVAPTVVAAVPPCTPRSLGGGHSSYLATQCQTGPSPSDEPATSITIPCIVWNQMQEAIVRANQNIEALTTVTAAKQHNHRGELTKLQQKAQQVTAVVALCEAGGVASSREGEVAARVGDREEEPCRGRVTMARTAIGGITVAGAKERSQRQRAMP